MGLLLQSVGPWRDGGSSGLSVSPTVCTSPHWRICPQLARGLGWAAGCRGVKALEPGVVAKQGPACTLRRGAPLGHRLWPGCRGRDGPAQRGHPGPHTAFQSPSAAVRPRRASPQRSRLFLPAPSRPSFPAFPLSRFPFWGPSLHPVVGRPHPRSAPLSPPYHFSASHVLLPLLVPEALLLQRARLGVLAGTGETNMERHAACGGGPGQGRCARWWVPGARHNTLPLPY